MEKIKENDFLNDLMSVICWIGDKGWSKIILPTIYFLLTVYLFSVASGAIMYAGLTLQLWDADSILNLVNYLRGF